MTAVVCPSCHSKLKAPSLRVGLKAKCPRCQSLIHVPAAVTSGKSALEDTKSHRTDRQAADGDTFEAVALDSTAVQAPIKEKNEVVEADSAPETPRRTGFFIRALAFVLVALAGAFAVWMALSETSSVSRRSSAQQSR
jgi:phage FluMu protein Com